MQTHQREQAEHALDMLERDGFSMGDGWAAAHDIAQANEGEPVFDRIHALIHRIEGDTGNARYWYRMAGGQLFEGSFSEEAAMIRQSLTR